MTYETRAREYGYVTGNGGANSATKSNKRNGLRARRARCIVDGRRTRGEKRPHHLLGSYGPSRFGEASFILAVKSDIEALIGAGAT